MAEGHAAAKLLIKQCIQWLALQVLHEYVQSRSVDVHGMHIYDVGMAEFSRLADLLAQEFERLGAEAFVQDLDREDLPGNLLIRGQVHHPHSPHAEFAHDVVAAGKPLTD